MNNSENSLSRIAVAQLGARRHYAVPLAFWRQNLLEHFFTDIYLKPGFHSAVKCAAGIMPVNGLKRLLGRYHPELPPGKVTTFWRLGKQYMGMASKADDITSAWLWAGEAFCRDVLKYGLGAANAVYAYSSASKELLVYCREHSLFGILDHATAPRGDEMKLVSEECRHFAEWSAYTPEESTQTEYMLRQKEEVELADLILCGSSFIKNLLINDQVPADKIAVVPLGINVQLSQPPSNRNGSTLNVLFVGGEGLRKGIGYLAEAAKLLSSDTIIFRAVGDLGLTKAGLESIAAYIDLLGPVPRVELSHHFEWADVLVLPSVSETFGLVVLEALASGIPVITTVNTCGPDVIREGEDGFVVPIRDARAIAEKLDSLASDRVLLNEMKRSAYIRAGDFSIGNYSRNLVKAIRSMGNDA